MPVATKFPAVHGANITAELCAVSTTFVSTNRAAVSTAIISAIIGAVQSTFVTADLRTDESAVIPTDKSAFIHSVRTAKHLPVYAAFNDPVDATQWSAINSTK